MNVLRTKSIEQSLDDTEDPEFKLKKNLRVMLIGVPVLEFTWAKCRGSNPSRLIAKSTRTAPIIGSRRTDAPGIPRSLPVLTRLGW